ncbi:unnamed protein product, partial [Phaeothamnion confervicola]
MQNMRPLLPPSRPSPRSSSHRIGGYALRVHGRLGDPSPALLYRMESGEIAIIRSARDLEQGDALGPIFFSLGILAATRVFRASAAADGCALVGFLNDLVLATGLPDSAELSLALVAAVQRLRADPSRVGLTLNMTKSAALCSGDAGARRFSPGTTIGLTAPGVPGAPVGIRFVGVPIGTEEFVRTATGIEEAGDIDRPIYALQYLPQALVASVITRSSLAPQANFEARASSPFLAADIFRHFDAKIAYMATSLASLAPPEPLPGVDRDDVLCRHPGDGGDAYSGGGCGGSSDGSDDGSGGGSSGSGEGDDDGAGRGGSGNDGGGGRGAVEAGAAAAGAAATAVAVAAVIVGATAVAAETAVPAASCGRGICSCSLTSGLTRISLACRFQRHSSRPRGLDGGGLLRPASHGGGVDYHGGPVGTSRPKVLGPVCGRQQPTRGRPKTWWVRCQSIGQPVLPNQWRRRL